MTGRLAEAAVAAVDLGAESGRVMLASVAADRLAVTEVHRFPNGPVRVHGTLHWDVLRLYEETVAGLRATATRTPELHSAGIDSWAVDYGLLDVTGALIGNPVHYRDARTAGVMDRVVGELGATELYRTTGLQLQPFNTLFQLAAAAGTPQLAAAHRLLMIPDLLSYWLTGEAATEQTNASTTQLLDVSTRTWASGLMRRAGIPTHLFGPLRAPGEPAGRLHEHLGIGPVPVITVGPHDTASAVVAVPMEKQHAAYISCGTWSLVGVELTAPVLSEASRLANFTNEAGVDGTVRYLRNVMGLWLLQESLRAWGADLPAVLQAAARSPGLAAVVDAADPVFLPPGDIPARIASACRATGQTPPATPGETARCILDSLALAHRVAVRQAQALSGHHVEVVHIVGGGARNPLLCQLTADACQLPVVAGPIEATAIGNALVQASALGVAGESLPELRALVRRTQPLRRYEPAGGEAPWREAAQRIGMEEK
jgi:rhamnulokinase